MHKWWWTRWWRGRWEWGTALSTNASRTSITQQFSQKTRWILAELTDYWGGISGFIQNLVRQKKEGTRRKRKGVGEQVGPACTWGWRSWSTGESSPRPWPSTGMRSHLKLLGSEPTNLWPSEQSEKHSDKPCCCLSYLGQGCKSTGVHGSWELEPWGLRNDPEMTTTVDRGESAGPDGMEEICSIECFLRKAMRT